MTSASVRTVVKFCNYDLVFCLICGVTRGEESVKKKLKKSVSAYVAIISLCSVEVILEQIMRVFTKGSSEMISNFKKVRYKNS